jgi:glycosyltransferase involved in cell wall biosynthesis
LVAVDIIIPTRDYGRFLGAALSSALSQTEAQILVTVVDDGSSDGTADVVAQFDPSRVTYLRLEPSRGLAAARNAGLGATHQPFITFLDADDILPRDRTRRLMDLLRESDAGYAYGVSQTFADPKPPGSDPSTLVHGPGPGNTLMRRTLFDRFGFLDEGIAHLSLTDWLLRIQRAGVTGISTEEVVVHRRLHSTNMSRKDDKRRDALALVRRHRAASDRDHDPER